MADVVDATKENLEREILKVIAHKLRARKMKAERSAKIAKVVLSKLEMAHSLAEIHEALPEMSLEFEELGEVLDPMYQEFNTRIHAAIDERLDQLIAAGKIKEVHNLVEGVYAKEVYG